MYFAFTAAPRIQSPALLKQINEKYSWHFANSLRTCIIIEAIQGLIPLDDVTLKHKNRAD